MRAGALTCDYVGGELRNIRLGDIEVLRRVYVAFQDRNWTARPWIVTDDVVVDAAGDSFTITVNARGTFDAEPFTWSAAITGKPDGTIAYAVAGRARAQFVRNRLGICILHPIEGVAGQACTVERVTGQTVQSSFPLEISPHQPFLDVRALTHEVMPGVVATVRFAGETFESEDHRNWSDASFKTYCTPISVPFPVTVKPGDVIEQAVTLSLAAPLRPTNSGQERPVTSTGPRSAAITVLSPTRRKPLPGLGFQADADGHELTDHEVSLLRALAPAHLRIDIDAASTQARSRLNEGLLQARSLGANLVPALFVASLTDLEQFSDLPEIDATAIDHWLVFDPSSKVTPMPLLAAARRALGPRAVIGGGTNLYFTELNRERPETSDADILSFSINPQVHASDDETIIQNLATQAIIAANARAICGSARISVSPVTLRPRFNPNATAPELDVSNTPLPSDVDARQSSGLGAAWTAMSVKYLAEGGSVDAITYFELTGWKGLLERDSPMQPMDFRSSPGDPFPLYKVFASLVGFTHVRPCTSSDPSRFDALIVEAEGSFRILVANFTAEVLSISVSGISNASQPSPDVTIAASPYSVTVYDLATTTP
ncbi:MAG: hypothetical protein F2793_08900 [Actinobacteria bacterium]|uniref:Unannotated protein n=1 Tax=freshwater metagenome TaxID=449393 RepID=A0A6J7ESZ2_9ZZZZ|nr:hypothetical protein [Actinomycetota bacterium]